MSNGAHVHIPLNLEIPTEPPIRSPRILNIPKSHTLINSIPSSQNRMVDILGLIPTALSRINTSFVILEAGDNLERNGHRSSLMEPLRELDFVALCDVVASVFAIRDISLWLVHTFVGLGYVGVCLVRLQASVVADVLECMGRQAAVAAVVVECACAVD